MAIAIVGSETLDWENQERVNAVVDSILRQKIKIITGYGKGLDAIVRAALFDSKKQVHCEFYSNILNILKDGKKEGLIAFAGELCPSTAKPKKGLGIESVWDVVASAIYHDIPTIVFSENTMPQWNGGKWVTAGLGVWVNSFKWVKGDLLI